MSKAIHAQKSKAGARGKTKLVVAALKEMKFKEADAKVENGIGEMLTYADFLSDH